MTPEVLDTAAIDALVTADNTWLIDQDGCAAGLWSFRSMEMYGWGVSQFCGFYELFYRLRSDLPVEDWVEGCEAVIGYLAGRNDIVRITLPVPEFDETGRNAAVAMGFTSAGVLRDVVGAARSSCGQIAYTRVYEQDRST
ncbi:hypothetical protein ACFWN2_00995 [Lentzea sp. NPDC058436]|uniref:hypothetical protein n=1 Tax=Lentzea sp. NPDC058436 TaxID=3346499 RepID=UPI0036550977